MDFFPREKSHTPYTLPLYEGKKPYSIYNETNSGVTNPGGRDKGSLGKTNPKSGLNINCYLQWFHGITNINKADLEMFYSFPGDYRHNAP